MNVGGGVHRGTSNRNDRGNSADRRRLTAWMVETFGNDGVMTCYRCAVPLLAEDLTKDRIVPGRDGGKYVKGNVRPCCAPCNSETGGALARRSVDVDV